MPDPDRSSLTPRQQEFVDFLRSVEGGWAHEDHVAEAMDTSKPGLVLNKLTFDLNIATCRVSKFKGHGYDFGLREIVRPETVGKAAR